MSVRRPKSVSGKVDKMQMCPESCRIIDLQLLRWQWLLINNFYDGYDYWFTNFTMAMISDLQHTTMGMHTKDE